jgi:density-regulated protein DRP1
MSVIEDEKAPISIPVIVSYCTICSLPPEYCKYGPMWDLHNGEKTAASANTPVVVESKTSGTVITIKIAPRVGRRYLTTISGLEKFDVDIGKACKVFAKKFACGVGSKDSEIEIQGDVEESIIETITSNWKQIKSRNLVIRRKEK